MRNKYKLFLATASFLCIPTLHASEHVMVMESVPAAQQAYTNSRNMFNRAEQAVSFSDKLAHRALSLQKLRSDAQVVIATAKDCMFFSPPPCDLPSQSEAEDRRSKTHEIVLKLNTTHTEVVNKLKKLLQQLKAAEGDNEEATAEVSALRSTHADIAEQLSTAQSQHLAAVKIIEFREACRTLRLAQQTLNAQQQIISSKLLNLQRLTQEWQTMMQLHLTNELALAAESEDSSSISDKESSVDSNGRFERNYTDAELEDSSDTSDYASCTSDEESSVDSYGRFKRNYTGFESEVASCHTLHFQRSLKGNDEEYMDVQEDIYRRLDAAKLLIGYCQIAKTHLNCGLLLSNNDPAESDYDSLPHPLQVLNVLALVIPTSPVLTAFTKRVNAGLIYLKRYEEVTLTAEKLKIVRDSREASANFLIRAWGAPDTATLNKFQHAQLFKLFKEKSTFAVEIDQTYTRLADLELLVSREYSEGSGIEWDIEAEKDELLTQAKDLKHLYELANSAYLAFQETLFERAHAEEDTHTCEKELMTELEQKFAADVAEEVELYQEWATSQIILLQLKTRIEEKFSNPVLLLDTSVAHTRRRQTVSAPPQTH